MTPFAYTLSITVSNQFIAFHRWDEAPDEVAFLRQWHRHVFKVRTTVEVSHANRQEEFFIVQRAVQELIDGLEGQYVLYSCEQIAELIAQHMQGVKGYILREVAVSEDGENEARLTVLGSALTSYDSSLSAPVPLSLTSTKESM